MPAIDLVDDTFVSAAPELVAQLVADPSRWASWWPDLRLETTRDRGVKGRQWRVGGALRGTSEIWLEPWRDGVLVHYYLRADLAGPSARPSAGPALAARADRERRRRAQEWKRAVHRMKDALEHGREPGGAAVPRRLPDLKVPRRAADDRADEC